MRTTELNSLLKSKALNGWHLFWLIGGMASVVMVVAMLRTDLSDGPGVSSMIQLSVRWAIPLLFIAFAASSLQILFPGPSSAWVLKNRKYFGLAFSAAMAWQGFFILWLVTVHTGYYVDEVYVLRDVIEGVTGYLFLLAMTVTTFMPVRKRMRPKNWKLLHKSGIYFLWAYAFSTYWWSLFYYDDPVFMDYFYYLAGLLAWGLRVAAWGKQRDRKRAKVAPTATGRPTFLWPSIAIVSIGVFTALSGSVWQPVVEPLLAGNALTRLPETYLPYWPFEPFLACFIIVFGVYLVTTSRREPA